MTRGSIGGGAVGTLRTKPLPRDPHGPTFIQDQVNRVVGVIKDSNEINRDLGELVTRLQRHVDGILGSDPPTEANGRAQVADGPGKEPGCTLEALQQAITGADNGLHMTRAILAYLAHQIERVERL